MQQHPYSVLPLAQFNGQLIFTPCPGTKGTKPFEALQTVKDAGASALLTLTGLVATRLLIESGVPFCDAIRDVQSLHPRAIQHPAHIEYIGQFDTRSNAH